MDIVSGTEVGKKFSVSRRVQSFRHAFQGLSLFLRTTHNAWIHVAVFCVTILLGLYYGIARLEWVALLFASGLVFVAEAFNTAIEIDMNLTSPDYHPYAKDTKDVAAAAVLIAAFTAIIVGALIFGPYLF